MGTQIWAYNSPLIEMHKNIKNSCLQLCFDMRLKSAKIDT